jgi:hypothetical protein
MYDTDWKSVVIGVLVAILTLDFMYAFSVKQSSNVFDKAMDSMSTSSGLVAIVVSLMIGTLCWYLSSRNTHRRDRK